MRQRDNHESYEVFAGRLHWIGALLLGSLVGIVWLMYVLSKTWLGPPPEAPRGGAVPAPRLQPNPDAELARVQARERALLEGYQWVNRDAGIARIPIERAMQLLAGSAQGPAASAAPTPASPPSARPAQLQSSAPAPRSQTAAPAAQFQPSAQSQPSVAAAQSRPSAASTSVEPTPRGTQAAPPPPRDLYRRAGVDQHLGVRVPLRLTFRDSDGRSTTLEELAHGKPTLLALGYYRCPNLCDMTLHGMARAAASMPLQVGRDYQVAFVSIDPSETPGDAHAMAAMLEHDDPAGQAGRWHLLTGTEAAIRGLSATTGFKYFRDDRIGQYAHAAGVVVLTGQGLIAQYFFGVSFSPRDLRLALVNASSGRLGTILDRLVLLCCAYDPSTGRYSLLIGRIMEVLGLLFLLIAGTAWWTLHRRTRT